jgi:anti-sigma factor RsiW
MTDPPPDPTTLHRLLGPAEPESTCEECFDQLDAYVDRELLSGDAEQAMPELAAHLRGCPACAEDHASLRALVLDGPGR